MHHIEHKILTQFQKNPQKEFSTTDIIMQSSPEDYSQIQALLNSPEPKTCKLAMQKKAQLHRKFLYHINVLVNEHVLSVNGVRGKGEKIFSLAIDSGRILITKKNRKIVITKNANNFHAADEIEKEGILHRFDIERWNYKTNCALYEPSHDGLSNLYSSIKEALLEINDSVGINNFEKYLYSTSQETLAHSLTLMDLDTRDLGISMNLIIDLEKNVSDEKLVNFIENYCRLKPKHVFIIFLTTPRSFKKNENAIKSIVKCFAESEIKLNLQNANIRQSPILFGNSGTYSLPQPDWHNYQASRKKDARGVSICSNNIAIDMHKCSLSGFTSSEVRQVALRAAKTLLKATIERAKNVDSLRKVSMDFQDKDFFIYEKNIIRFWNYNLQDKNSNNTYLLLQSIAEEIESFCSSQRAIYNSCGIPSRFDICFSSAFSRFSKTLSSKAYSKMTIRKITDFQDEEISSFVSKKEDLGKIFNASDRSRFFRKGDVSEVFRELMYLLSSTTLELVTYDFRENRGDSKLTSYLWG